MNGYRNEKKGGTVGNASLCSITILRLGQAYIKAFGLVMGAGLFGWACSTVPEGKTNVQFDIASVRKQALSAGVQPERAFLNVRGPGIDPDIRIAMDLLNPSFDALIPSGPNRLIEVMIVGEVLEDSADTSADDDVLTDAVLSSAQQALVQEIGGRPLYWGARLVNMAPRATINLDIQAFKAGLVAGTVTRSDGGALPNKYFFELRAQDDTTRRQGMPERIPVPIDAAGRYLTLLPTGSYNVEASLQEGGVSFEMPADVEFNLSQGQVIVPLDILLADPSFCNPQDPVDFDDDGIPCDEDCDDTNPHCGANCKDRDGDLYCEDFDCDDRVLTGGAGCQTECPDFYVDTDGDSFPDEIDPNISSCLNPAPDHLSQTLVDCRPGDDDPIRSDPNMLWFRDLDGDSFLGAVPYIGCNPPQGAVPNVQADGTVLPASAFDCDDNPGNGCGVACYPGNVEIGGDGFDNDCDGSIDESTVLCYVDADSDGRGKAGSNPVPAGSAGTCPGNRVPNDDDCDDTQASIHAGALEIPADGIDQNCDGREACYIDKDGDGYGGLPYDGSPHPVFALSPNGTLQCVGTFAGHALASRGYDCDDDDAGLNWDDVDQDGDPSCVGDCNDNDDSIREGQTEVCNNGRDDDCDGETDSSDSDCQQGYPDADGDGYPANIDCDDSDSSLTLLDRDGDGYSSCGSVKHPVQGIPEPEEQDCNDDPTNGGLSEHPGRIEKCGDGIDNDCNPATPDDCSAVIGSMCRDDDGDGYLADAGPGTCSIGILLDCDDDPTLEGGVPRGARFNYDDIDGDRLTTCPLPGEPADHFETSNPSDASALAPLPVEFCYDGVDNDGDGQRDLVDPDCHGLDHDNDGFIVGDCDNHLGWVLISTDEDDMMQACIFDCKELYPDADNDGFGSDGATSIFSCQFDDTQAPNNGDCDDADPSIFPNAEETCSDGKDNDCNGISDDRDADRDGFWACDVAHNPLPVDCNDDLATGGALIMPLDLDGDGYKGCDSNPALVDCDDQHPEVNPGVAVDRCEPGYNLDNNCDGVIDDGEDFDGDGVGDCDDNCLGVSNPPPAAARYIIEWMAADCNDFNGTYEVFVDGASIGSLNPGNCSDVSPASDIISSNLSAWDPSKDNLVEIRRTDMIGHGEIQWAHFKVEGDVSGYTPTPTLTPESNGCLIDVGYNTGSNPSFPCDLAYAPTGPIAMPCHDCPPASAFLAQRISQVIDNTYSPNGPECSVQHATDCPNPLATVGYEICSDSMDNDCDGMLDEGMCVDMTECVDGEPDGAYADAPALTCGVPVGNFDCDDTDSSIGAGVGFEGSLSECSDGKDNDCNGLTDREEFICQGPLPDTSSITAGRPLSLGTVVANSARSIVAMQSSPCSIEHLRNSPCNGGTASGQSFWFTFDSLPNPGAPQTKSLKICNEPFATVNLWLLDFDANPMTGVINSESCMPGLATSLPPGQCHTLTVPDGDADGFDDPTSWSIVALTDGDYGSSCSDNIAVRIEYEGDDCALRDDDQDGYNACVDCEDFNPDVHPGAMEVCDFRDNNCDNKVDEGVEDIIIASFDFETDPSWNVNSGGALTSWGLTSTTKLGPQGPVGLPSVFYGTDGNQSLSSPEIENSQLISTPIGLSPYTDGALGVRFDSWTYNEGCNGGGPYIDHEFLEFSPNGGATWIEADRFRVTDCSYPLHIDYDGHVRAMGSYLDVQPSDPDLRLRFGFDSNDANDNLGQDDGWYIDNVEVYTCPIPSGGGGSGQ